MKVLLNRSYGAHFTRCQELLELKKRLRVTTWEEFVTDQRVVEYIEKTLTPKEREDQRTLFKVVCGLSRPTEGKIALEEVDTSKYWIIHSYDNYESVKYLTKVENNEYRDESKSIYEY